MRCACSVPEQNKKIPKFSEQLNRDTESQRERERENPKPKSWKPKTVTARPSLAAPLTPADCCYRRRRSVTPCPRAVRPSGSALRSGMFLFCFFFFSFPVFLFRFCSSATSLLLTYLSLAIVVCWLIILSSFFYYRIVGWLFIQQTTPKIYTHIILKMGPKITISL